MGLFRRKPVTAAVPPIPAQFRALAADRGLLRPTRLPWQAQARWFAQNVGLARFGAAIVSETISRMTPIAERRVGRDWVKGADQTVQDLIDAYVTMRQQQQSLLRLHAWHYQVSGEMYMAETDTMRGPQFHVFMADTVDLKKKGPTAEVKLRPDAKLGDGMLVIPKNQLWRVWWADENWPLLASSPLRAVLDDLQRYMALSGTVSRTAVSALLEAGLVWTPDEAHVPLAEETQQSTGFYSELERDYYELAQLALAGDDRSPAGATTHETLAMYAPAMIRWSDQYKAPIHVDLKRTQDPMNIEALEWCVKAYARGTNLPNQLVVDGQGQGNHWSAWLVDEKFHLSTTAPYADQIFHTDVTEFYLRPTLRVLKLLGEWNGNPENWRMGYDATPVLVHPDRSVQSIQLYQIGLLKAESVLRENGMSVGDLPSEEELGRIIQTLQQIAGPGPGRPNEGAQTTPLRQKNNSTVTQNQPNTSDARFALQASTRLALREARRRADVKLGTRARSRNRPELVPAAGTAITAALVKSVGVTAEELLDRAFVEAERLALEITGDAVRAAAYGGRLLSQATADLAYPASEAGDDDAVDWVIAAAVG